MTASPGFIATGSSTKKTAQAVNLPSGTTSRVADAVSMTVSTCCTWIAPDSFVGGQNPKIATNSGNLALPSSL
jgi:hypothetical protein